MSEPFIGEIKMFGGNFPPRSWAECNGQLLSIAQNTALFSLFGTTYGGDGESTFALPELRGRLPMHMGTGPGLSNRRIGEKSGQETVALTAANLPQHTHNMGRSGAAATQEPGGHTYAPDGANAYGTGDPVEMSSQAVSNEQNPNMTHSNMQPFSVINFIVALAGVYPSRN